MNKFIIIYKGIPIPVQAKSKKQIIAKMQKDWKHQQKVDSDFFTTYGININYQDFSKQSFELLSLRSWFKQNKVKSK